MGACRFCEEHSFVYRAVRCSNDLAIWSTIRSDTILRRLSVSALKLVALEKQSTRPQFQGCFESEMGQLLIVTLMAVVFVIASFLATAGVIRGALYVTLGRKIGFADTFTGPYFGAFALTTLLIMVIFIAGLFLFVLPAIFAILLFQFAPFFALDRGLSPFHALKSSVGLVRLHWPLAILVLLFSGASYLISGLFWGIPTLLFLPLAALVTAYVYRSLQGETVDPAA